MHAEASPRARQRSARPAGSPKAMQPINPLVSTMMTCSTRTAPRRRALMPQAAVRLSYRCRLWTVALSSLKQCAKTYEIRRTPTPVRVTEALQAAVLEGVARPARARAGLLLAWDLKCTCHNRRGAAPGRSRALPSPRPHTLLAPHRSTTSTARGASRHPPRPLPLGV